MSQTSVFSDYTLPQSTGLALCRIAATFLLCCLQLWLSQENAFLFIIRRMYGKKTAFPCVQDSSARDFENIACLAKHAGSSILDTAKEWLEEFSVFSICQLLPVIISLWGVNLETQSEGKKRHAIDQQITAPLPAPLRASWDLHSGSRPAHGTARQ